MLKNFFMRAAVTAAALTCTTGSASAENFDILIMEMSFFPSVSYVQPGDTLTFINESGVDRDIRSRNLDWFIPDLANGASASIVIEDSWKNEYLSRIKGSGNGETPTDTTETNADDSLVDLTGDETVPNEAGTIMGVLNYSGAPDPVVSN